jgi:nucleoside-diphosphate-sugar epimerase
MKQTDVVRTYCTTTDKKVRMLYVPMWFVKTASWFLEKALKVLGKQSPLTPYRLDSAIGPRDFDCSKAKEQLDWEPKVGVFGGLNGVRSQGTEDRSRGSQ